MVQHSLGPRGGPSPSRPQTQDSGVLAIGAVQDLDDATNYRRGWRSRPSRWFGHLSEPPTVRWNYWSKEGSDVDVRITDADGRFLREMNTAATPGLNVFDWDMLLDDAMALRAEADLTVNAPKKREPRTSAPAVRPRRMGP